MAEVTRTHAVTTGNWTHTPESVFAGSRYKKEDKYGEEKATVGQGFSKFFSLSVTPTIQQETKNIEVNGTTLPVGVLKSTEYSEWNGSGAISYADFNVLIDVDSSGPIDPVSYTLQHYDLRSEGCVVKNYTISGSPLDLNMEVGFVGKKITKGVDTPTNDVTPTGFNKFYEPTNTEIYIDNKLVERVNAFSLSVDGIWTIGNFIDNDYQTILQSRVNGEFDITEPMVNTEDYSVWKPDTGVSSIKIQNETEIDNQKYWFTVEFDVMWQTPSEPSDTDSMWTVQNKATIIHKENQPSINIQSGITDVETQDHNGEGEGEGN